MSTENATTSSQRQVDMFFKNKRPLDPETRTKCNKSLVRFIASRVEPFTIVEDETNQDYSRDLNDRYKLPCAKTVKYLMIQEANHVRNEIRKRVKEIQYGASACIDLWSSSVQESYLGVDIHYITENFILEHVTLCTLPFEYPHTTVRLAEALERVFEEFDLQGKMTSIVTDNCSNMLALKRHFPNIEMMQCVLHVFQLSAKSLFQTNMDVLTKCRELVNHFTQSNKENESLLKAQEASRPNEVPVSYIRDIPVRWSSTHDMLKRILKLRQAVTFLANSAPSSSIERSSLRSVLLSEADYARVSILVHLLEPLAHASNALQASQHATISQVYPFTRMLLHNFDRPVDDEAMDQVRKEILDDLQKKMGSPKRNTWHRLLFRS